jgi:hypothetical protein
MLDIRWWVLRLEQHNVFKSEIFTMFTPHMNGVPQNFQQPNGPIVQHRLMPMPNLKNFTVPSLELGSPSTAEIKEGKCNTAVNHYFRAIDRLIHNIFTMILFNNLKVCLTTLDWWRLLNRTGEFVHRILGLV